MLYVYNSKRWFDIGNQPKGQIRVQEGNKANETLIAYDRKLTEDEIYEFELKFIGNV